MALDGRCTWSLLTRCILANPDCELRMQLMIDGSRLKTLADLPKKCATRNAFSVKQALPLPSMASKRPRNA